MNNLHLNIQALIENSNTSYIVVLITALLISLYSIPIILNFARAKNFYDKPNGRTSHDVNTPTLGGIAIFAGVIISLLLFNDGKSNNELQYLIACITIMFFIGIKDDIYLITLPKKLFAQLTVVFIFIFFADIRISSLSGFLGIYEIPFFLSAVLSTFVFIVIINCFNLIDGVDGLAAGITLLIAFVFSIFFFERNMTFELLITASLIGALIPFFIYNVFGKKNKLFMGDTGALIIGVISVFLVVRFNNLALVESSTFEITAAPAMSIAILFVPLYDTLQVFVIRVFKNRSPFSPDKNHLHHRLLRLGLNHIQTSMVLILLNTVVIISSYNLQSLGILALSFILLFIGLIFSSTLWYTNKRKNHILT